MSSVFGGLIKALARIMLHIKSVNKKLDWDLTF